MEVLKAEICVVVIDDFRGKRCFFFIIIYIYILFFTFVRY